MVARPDWKCRPRAGLGAQRVPLQAPRASAWLRAIRTSIEAQGRTPYIWYRSGAFALKAKRGAQ
eukprot:2804897-Alexandrium_andersonii.AAC.1